MIDPFLKLGRPLRTPEKKSDHSERAHSKFSASGAERWFACPGSVELSEGMPDKSSIYAEEGTYAHEILEALLRVKISENDLPAVEHYIDVAKNAPEEMLRHVENTANFIYKLHRRTPLSEILVETRIYLDFIHPEMFGTFDGAVLDHFDTLHVFDFKYGAGHSVSVKENLQMIFYAIGVAARYQWNFKKARLWIIQPRIQGYDGPTFWDLNIEGLKSWSRQFETAVAKVLKTTGAREDFNEGSHCHWCKAKSKCPLKQEMKIDRAKTAFAKAPVVPS